MDAEKPANQETRIKILVNPRIFDCIGVYPLLSAVNQTLKPLTETADERRWTQINRQTRKPELRFWSIPGFFDFIGVHPPLSAVNQTLKPLTETADARRWTQRNR